MSEFMTEEDEWLVAQASLLGVTFTERTCLTEHNLPYSLWSCSYDKGIEKYSLPRCAEFVLFSMGLRTQDEHHEYDTRTEARNSHKPDPKKVRFYGA